MADRHGAIYTTGDTAIFVYAGTPLGRSRRREIAAVPLDSPSSTAKGNALSWAMRV